MNIVKVLVIVCVMIQPSYADVTVIEWGAKNTSAQVDIYVTSWCPYCKKAIAYLDANEIKYNKYDIEEDVSAAVRKKELAPDYTGIPLAKINGIILKGFSREKYALALDK